MSAKCPPWKSTPRHLDEQGDLSGFCAELNMVAPTGYENAKPRKILVSDSFILLWFHVLKSEQLRRLSPRTEQIFPISGPEGTASASRQHQGRSNEGELGESGKPVLNNNSWPLYNNSFWFTEHFHRRYLI